MYYKINKTGVSECRGLVEIRYDLFLEPGDHNYNLHHVTVPIIPEGGYPGEVDLRGFPVDDKDYKQWLRSLPTETKDNPFCCHFVQCEPSVTDQEIIDIGVLALAMSYQNWQNGNLHKNKNLPVQFSNNPQKKAACAIRVNQIKDSTMLPFVTVAAKVR